MLKWFEAKAKQRLRRSQINMLYQNYLAFQFLSDYLQPVVASKQTGYADLQEELSKFEFLTVDAVTTLMWDTVLDDQRTKELSAVNTLLKVRYAEAANARNAIIQLGSTAPALPPFTERFSPPGGWGAVDENVWAEMCEWALGRAKETPPPF